jgi:outer membrane protein assembly factor BamB
VVAVSLLWLVRFVVPVVLPEQSLTSLAGELVGALAVLVWWLFFSRAPSVERLGALVLMAAAMFATMRFLDKSIATGAQGLLFVILALPGLCLALVLWAVLTRHASDTVRRTALVASIVIACGFWTLVRTGGFTGNFKNDLNWRWMPTAEERLLAEEAKKPPVPSRLAEPAPVPAAPVPVPTTAPAAKEIPEKRAAAKAVVEPDATRPARAEVSKVAEWRGFRGPFRDGIIPGVRIETDWSGSPPVKLWQRPVGPGWSSFAVRGDFFYTQEQRGPDEVVACYRVSTGEPVWAHRDAARFWESNAGAGPRSTPTLGSDRLYTFGATGIVNALNVRDGAVVWSRNGASDAEKKVPEWGFASSPLLFDDLVIVAVSGQLVGYDRATGAPRWLGPRGGTSYSSPQLVTINGVPQVLLLSGTAATSVSPADGKVLWEHQWKGYPIVQPALTAEGDLLLSVSESSGIRRIGVAHDSGGWRVEERWTSPGLKPYFNDFVVHHGHAFGFDASILACIDLKDGKRKWKGGRYGHGQLVLLPDQDLLLVLSEDGELALIKAVPDEFKEVARFPAIEGKTWNHPVLVGDVLLARNSEEMAAFRLSLAHR